MPDPLDQLQDLKRITIGDDARARIRNRLELFTSLKPREIARAGAYLPAEDPASFEWATFFTSWKTRTFMAALFLAMTGTVTISAAEGALPGDLLYPIKVHVNEETQALFSRSEESRASFEVSRLARRLQEAGQLANQGRLTQEQETQLVTNIEKHSRSARSHIANAAQSQKSSVDVMRVQNELISTIAAYDGVLSDIVSKPKRERSEPLTQVRSALEGEIAAAALSGIEVAASRPSITIAPDDLADRVEVLDTRLNELVLIFPERVLPGNNSNAQVDQLLIDAQDARSKSKTALESENLITALLALMDGERALVELEAFLGASTPVVVTGTSTPSSDEATTTPDVAVSFRQFIR
ncbi:MAG: DUF5667 domain-containing protein [bacterium]|nr:DUF5667 domain-containing protein [bacterium]